MKVFVVVIYAIICVILSGIILLQESKSAGLGSIAGMGDSYWNKAKSRSMEGNLNKLTSVLAILFLVLSFVLNLIW